MSCQPQNRRKARTEASREQFADGSALVTYPDGSMLILESELAREAVFMEGCPVNYNEPPPRRVAIGSKHRN